MLYTVHTLLTTVLKTNLINKNISLLSSILWLVAETSGPSILSQSFHIREFNTPHLSAFPTVYRNLCFMNKIDVLVCTQFNSFLYELIRSVVSIRITSVLNDTISIIFSTLISKYSTHNCSYYMITTYKICPIK